MSPERAGGRGRLLVVAAAGLLAVCCSVDRTRTAAASTERGARAAPPPPSKLAPHPRLLLSPETIRRLKAKASARDPDWAQVLGDADRLSKYAVADYNRNDAPPATIAYTYQGFGWYGAIVPLGIAYQVTGNKRYAAKVVELLRKVNAATAAGNIEPISADSGFPSRSAALGVALAFDWVYPEIPPADRAATIATLNRWFDWYRENALDREGPAASNYFGGHLLGFGAAGYASAGDNPRAPEMMARAADDFANVVLPAVTDGPFAGGYPPEGYVYGTNHYVRLLEYMMLVATATGRTAPEVTSYAGRLATNLVHALKPNRWQVPDEADYPGDYTGVIDLGLPVVLSTLAAEPQRSNIQYLLGNLGKIPDSVNRPTPTVERLLFWDSTRPARDPAASEPLYYYSPGDEHLFMRSSWAGDATWVSFNGNLAVPSGHGARAGGHVAIQRGDDYLLVFAGQWKGKDGVAGSPQQFQTTSAYANTLFVSDGGEYLYPGERYAGGQSPWGPAGPLRHAQTADWSWGKLDLTPMYDIKPGANSRRRQSLRSFVRSFAYLNPGTVVLFDHVEVSKPNYVKQLRFYLNGAGALTTRANGATSVVGRSALHVQVLSPNPPAISVGWNEVNGSKLSPRLEVTNREPSTTMEGLTVLSAGDRALPPPASAAMTTDGGAMIGAYVRDRPLERIVLFSRAPDATVPSSAPLRYRFWPAGPSRHHLFDLAPDQHFEVRVEKAGGGAFDVIVAPAGSGGGAAVASNGVGALAFDVVNGQVRAAPAR
jgi:hypothetical protein